MIDPGKLIKDMERCMDHKECFRCPKAFKDGKSVCNESKKGVVFIPASFVKNAIELLKEQEVRELTIDEWREWKANPKRDPICRLWEDDTSPMWTLNPNEVHEPALLMGKMKLFTGKPTFEQCKAVKWNDN